MIEVILQYLIHNLSYLGVFISSIIVSASILIPLPSQLIPAGAVFLKLSPFLTAATIGIGSMIGEMTGYYLGVAGGAVVHRTLRKYKKTVATLRKYYHKYAFFVIFIAALLFFPFDLVGIMSGMSRYDIKKFFLAGFLGKFIKALIVFYLVQNGLHIFGFTGV